MADKDKTKGQLIEELAEMRQQIAELETSEAERKKTKKSLIRAASEWRATFDSLTDAVSIHDKNFRIVRMNQAAAKALKTDLKKLLGKTCYRVFHGTEAPPPDCPHVRAMATGNPVTAEFFEPHLGVHLEISASPIFADNGQITHSVHIAKDITERKRAREELLISEKKYRTLVENATEGIFVVQEGRICFFNSEALKLLQCSAEEIASSPFWDFIHPDDRSLARNRHNQRLTGAEVTSNYQVRLINRKGQTLWVHVKSVLITWEGRPAGMHLVREITDLKQAEDKIKKAYEFSKTILNSTNDAISVINIHDHTVAAANAVFLNQLGIKEEDAIGRTCYELTHKRYTPCEGPDDICPLIETLAGGGHSVVEHVHRGADGQKIYVEVSTSPIRDARGEIIQVVHVSKNITERKLAEEALREREALYSSLFEHSPNPLWEEDWSGVKAYIADIQNSGVKDIRQYFDQHQEEIVRCLSLIKIINLNLAASKISFSNEVRGGGTTYTDSFFAQKSWVGFKEIIIDIVEGQNVIEREISHKTAQGRDIYRIYKFSVAPGHEETLRRVFITATDITRHKEAENAILESEASLNEAQRIAHLGNWDWDLVNSKLKWSDELFRIFGLQPNEIAPDLEKYLIFIHPEDRYAAKESFNRALKNKKEYSMEYRIIRPDGSEHFVSDKSEIITDKDGRVISIRGTVSDITERKKAEAALRESEALYSSLFEQSPNPLWEEDWSEVKAHIDKVRDEGVKDIREYCDTHPEETVRIFSLIKIVKANHAAIKYDSSAEARGLIAKNTGRYFDQETWKQIIRALLDIVEGKNVVDQEMSHKSPDGKGETHGIFKLSVAPGHEKTLKRIFVSATDITERKRAEKEREQIILKLREALAQIRTLKGLVPICASCKKIRDDKGFWNALETYIEANSDAEFSHGICPECMKTLYPAYVDIEK